jgi:peptidyl-prolyl cis-trans isomerase D
LNKLFFSAKKTGVLNDVVETQFGYHIIDVTGVADYTTYSVATIEIAIAPSDETQNEAYLKAQTFASNVSGVDDFNESAKTDQLMVMNANDLKTVDRRINDLGDAREMITWLFREAKVGKVSEVFDLDTDYT